MKKTITLLGAFMIALMSIGFVSATNGKYVSMLSKSPGMANVRAIHLSPDAPGVDVLVNDNIAISDLEFGSDSGFTTVPADKYNFKVIPANSNGPIVIQADLTLEKRKDYTIVAVNTLDSIEPIVLEDWSFFFNKYKAKVRFVHASPDAPAVDIALKDGPVIFSDYSFKEVSDYKRFEGNTYDLEVRLAGTDTVVLEIPSVNLENGKVYTVFAKGFVSDGSLSALPVVDRMRG